MAGWAGALLKAFSPANLRRDGRGRSGAEAARVPGCEGAETPPSIYTELPIDTTVVQGHA